MTTRSTSTPSPELQARREIRALRQHLRDLTDTVTRVLAQLDAVMQGPATTARGQKIAELANALDMANDVALHFGLGLSFPVMARRKKTAKRTKKETVSITPP